jgi:predicted porin
MKKSLLAVAAMTAFAGAAQAQSSVTVYGILDVGFVGSQYNGTSATANAANVNNPAVGGGATTKQTTAGFGQSAESTSRIGFKGTEDLGGGTQAIFTLELGLSPMSNGASNSNTGVTAVSQPAVFGQINRQTFVGLKKNGLGTATIGTQYTPIFDVQSATDAAGNNNLVGNAVYSSNLQSSGGVFNQGVSPFGTTTTSYFDASYSAYTTRLSNSVKLQSDRIAGFAGQLFYAQANQNTNQTGANFSGTVTSPGGANNNTAWGLNADYEWKKLKVVAAYQTIKSYDPSTLGTITIDSIPTSAASAVSITGGSTATVASKAALAAGTADSFGTNSVDNQIYAAATYDFGILKSYLQYSSRQAYSVIDSNTQAHRQAYQIGARSQITPTISVYATYGLGKASVLGTAVNYNNFRTTQLGADYMLSKRTNLYAAYGSYNQSSAASSSATSNYSLSGMNYALGIRHTF